MGNKISEATGGSELLQKMLTDNKDGFMIQLWRPIGSSNVGGWSPQDFKADRPGSLHLNSEAFYQVQGMLKGGNILIKP